MSHTVFRYARGSGRFERMSRFQTPMSILVPGELASAESVHAHTTDPVPMFE
jgi:hypothetical protein